MDAGQLSQALETISATCWDSKQRPVLLSELPALLHAHLSADYRDALDGESLKTFIKKTSTQCKYRLVEHPTQRAKLGLLPADVSFEFPPEIISDCSTGISSADAQAFARVLLSLTDEEKKAVLLPGTLVVKLLMAK